MKTFSFILLLFVSGLAAGQTPQSKNFRFISDNGKAEPVVSWYRTAYRLDSINLSGAQWKGSFFQIYRMPLSDRIVYRGRMLNEAGTNETPVFTIDMTKDTMRLSIPMMQSSNVLFNFSDDTGNPKVIVIGDKIFHVIRKQ
jgi:hypothetical protein